jgi:hypothetical protein
MVDAAFGVEPGFLGDEQNAAAMRAIRPSEAFGRTNPCCRKNLRGLLARGLSDHHRRLSSTLLTAPYARIVKALCGATATAT